MMLTVRHLTQGLAILGIATPARAQTGLMVVAQGAGAQWNDGVRQVMTQVKWDGPMAVAFLMGDEAEASGWNAAVRELVREG